MRRKIPSSRPDQRPQLPYRGDHCSTLEGGESPGIEEAVVAVRACWLGCRRSLKRPGPVCFARWRVALPRRSWGHRDRRALRHRFPPALRGGREPQERLPRATVRHVHRHDCARRAQADKRQPLPRLTPRASPSRRARPHRPVLREGLHAARRPARENAPHGGYLGKPRLGDGREPGLRRWRPSVTVPFTALSTPVRSSTPRPQETREVTVSCLSWGRQVHASFDCATGTLSADRP